MLLKTCFVLFQAKPFYIFSSIDHYFSHLGLNKLKSDQILLCDVNHNVFNPLAKYIYASLTCI